MTESSEGYIRQQLAQTFSCGGEPVTDDKLPRDLEQADLSVPDCLIATREAQKPGPASNNLSTPSLSEGTMIGQSPSSVANLQGGGQGMARDKANIGSS